MTNNTIIVSSTAALTAALNNAQGGETILLKNGNYGSVDITKDFGSIVTIKSEKPLGASFDDLDIPGGSNIHLDGLVINSQPRVDQNASNISITNSDLNSGLYFAGIDGIVLDNNDISGGHHTLIMNNVSNFTVTNNNIHNSVEDVMRVTGDSYNGVIENNTMHDSNSPAGSSYHPDLLQMFAVGGKTPHDIEIRGNWMYDVKDPGGKGVQGIFLSDGNYKNIVIEQNLVHPTMTNGITMASGTEGVIIQNNTLTSGIYRLHNKGAKDNSGVTFTGNVGRVLDDETKDSTIGDNYLYGRNADTTQLFQNPGDPSDIASFLPVPGSDIDFGSGYGATERLLELLGEDPPVDPFPQPDPDPEPSDDIEGEMLLSQSNAEFNGTTSSARVLDHDVSFALHKGTIELSFNADSLGARRGLFSKDAYSYGNGGHVSIFADGDDIWIRLQDQNQSHEIRLDNAITIGKEVHLVFNFGDKGMEAYLNGELAGSNTYTGGLVGNEEPIVLGANQWGSSAGTADKLENVFEGTISFARLYNEQLSSDDLANLIITDPITIPGPNPGPGPEPVSPADPVDPALPVEDPVDPELPVSSNDNSLLNELLGTSDKLYEQVLDFKNNIDIYGFDLDGQIAELIRKGAGYGIEGGRYDFQLDYDGETGASEKFIIDFNSEVDDAILHFNYLSETEAGLGETGEWIAYDSNGYEVAKGTIDESSEVISANGKTFEIVEVRATSYGAGQADTLKGNNSDFQISDVII